MQRRKHNTVVSRCAEQKHSGHLKKRSSSPHQYLGDGAHWLFVLGNNADVEDGGKDEDEARSRGGTWEQTTVTVTDNGVCKAA